MIDGLKQQIDESIPQQVPFRVDVDALINTEHRRRRHAVVGYSVGTLIAGIVSIVMAVSLMPTTTTSVPPGQHNTTTPASAEPSETSTISGNPSDLPDEGDYRWTSDLNGVPEQSYTKAFIKYVNANINSDEPLKVRDPQPEMQLGRQYLHLDGSIVRSRTICSLSVEGSTVKQMDALHRNALYLTVGGTPNHLNLTIFEPDTFTVADSGPIDLMTNNEYTSERSFVELDIIDQTSVFEYEQTIETEHDGRRVERSFIVVREDGSAVVATNFIISTDFLDQTHLPDLPIPDEVLMNLAFAMPTMPLS